MYAFERVEPAFIALTRPVSDDSPDHRLATLASPQALANVEEHRGDPTMRMLRWFRRTAEELWQDTHRYYSFFRRAPRLNERFSVVGPVRRTALREVTREALNR